jgi:hypothetical protein
MPLIDFTKFDLSQLRQISRELNDEIEQKTEKEWEKAAAEIKRIAGTLGMTVEEILAGKKGKRGRRPKGKEHIPPLPPSVQQPVPEVVPEPESIEQKEEEKQKKEKKKPIKRQ